MSTMIHAPSNSSATPAALPQLDSLDQVIKRNKKATIAILSVLAIVLYFTYPAAKAWMHARQIRAIQLGAAGDLRMVLEKEKDFRQKFGFYTTDLKALGITPKAVVYKFGFVTPSWVTAEGIDNTRKDLDALKASDATLKIDYSPVTRLEAIDFNKLSSYCPDCSATRHTFKAVAAANLDEDAVLDVWTIDDNGVVEHLINDI